MPKFTITLSATAVVEGALTVVADDETMAIDEALKQLGAYVWHYQGLNEEPPTVLEVTPI